MFILSKNWEFSQKKPPFFSCEKPLKNLIFHAQKNAENTEKMTLISLEENENDDIPENFVVFSPKIVKKLEKLSIETTVKKCLNLGKLEAEELERISTNFGNFANEDNFLLFSHWRNDFDFFHQELMNLAVFWRFRKPNGPFFGILEDFFYEFFGILGEMADGVMSVSKILMNKFLLNNLVTKNSVFEANPLRIEISVENRVFHDFSTNSLIFFF